VPSSSSGLVEHGGGIQSVSEPDQYRQVNLKRFKGWELRVKRCGREAD
jgi:hypothetical protein